MSVRQQRLLWLWGGLLAALLCLLFLPLTAGERGFAILLTMIVVIAALVSVGHRPGGLAEGEGELNELPESPYRLPVVLVCGDTLDWPGEGSLYRTAQGCWLKVSTAQLRQTVRHLLWQRPELVAQLAVMIVVRPQQHDDEAMLITRLHELRWQLAQVRRDTRRTVPLLLVSAVAGASVAETLWQSVRAGNAPQVWQADRAPNSLAHWLSQGDSASRMQAQVRVNAQARYMAEAVLPALTANSPDMPPAMPAMVLYHQAPSSAVPALADSLWSRWLARHTTLNQLPGWQPGTLSPDDAPLPDCILPLLPQGGGTTPRNRTQRRAFSLFTLAVLVALCSSAWNNRQLLHRLAFDVSSYYRIGMTDTVPKARAVARLRSDVALLNNWSRNGEPLRYGLGLYRGEQLRPAVLAAIQTYVPPPPPPPPVINKVIQGPQTVRLDSMSLFATGQWQLKPGSTKVLVNALVGIKARPGWLIVVAGHTDSTGDEKSNQILSLQRAESVRNWMRDTGSVPESCFAVQGYGESRPVATNDTPEGRALNRRVDISLVPQANACRMPGKTPLSPQQGDANKQ
ncbi:OmpA family protein [Pseudescherichia vulneris]|uniref:OmpA family protein n=1 Tax=Pseudescherichia vulneris TaxID=566 RepID=UPI0028A76F9C|nr:OmpA family protein [Pseudescherichia vulneris]